ncbi:MAG: hypothetical protein WEB53_10445 [Akkermansiaceae bacterium]
MCNGFIGRLLAEGEEAAGATAEDCQRETSEKDREYDATASGARHSLLSV